MKHHDSIESGLENQATDEDRCIRGLPLPQRCVCLAIPLLWPLLRSELFQVSKHPEASGNTERTSFLHLTTFLVVSQGVGVRPEGSSVLLFQRYLRSVCSAKVWALDTF